jgi:hypothetical protein
LFSATKTTRTSVVIGRMTPTVASIGPPPGDQVAVPPQQRAGVTKNAVRRCRGTSLDNPASTARSAGFQIQAPHLPAQHRDLVSQHQRLHCI